MICKKLFHLYCATFVAEPFLLLDKRVLFLFIHRRNYVAAQKIPNLKAQR